MNLSTLTTLLSLLKIPATVILVLHAITFRIINFPENLLRFAVIWFIVLFVLEVILTTNTTIQSFKQIISTPYLCIKNKFKLLDVNTFVQKNRYILPFDGEWLVFNGGISKKSSHSWSIKSQKYAYDFIMIDYKGNSYKGSKKDPESYYCFAQNILAPADGIIVEVRENCSESKIFGLGPILDTYIKDIRGNYIVIQHEGGECSTLAHLKKDSILVKVGQTVKQGSVIAQCGNTGNSSEPHLHFQVQTGKSFFFSVSAPVKFSNISTTISDSYENLYLRKILADELNDGFLTRGVLVKSLED